MDDADGILRALVALGGHVSAADTDADGHVQLAAVGNRGDDVIGVHQVELARHLQIGAGHRAGALGEHVRGRLVGLVRYLGEHQALHVQHDVGDVLDDAFRGSELVLDALDLDGGGLSPVQRGEQHATHGVAQRVAVAALERLDDVAGNGVVDFLRGNGRPHELCHVWVAS